MSRLSVQVRLSTALLALAFTIAPALAEKPAVIVVPGVKIGVVLTDRSAAAVRRLDVFRARIMEEIGVGVTMVTVKDGLALVDAIATKRVDYAILTATAYAMAVQVCACVEPLVVPQSTDGTSSYRSILIVRAESAAQKMTDLRGKSLAAADARSVAGRAFPFTVLSGSGYEPSAFFDRIETTRGPESAVQMLLAGKVDAAIGWSTVEGDVATGYSRGTLRDLVQKKQLAMKDIRIVWQSPPIPHGPHAVRADMPDEQKALLRDALLNMRDQDPDAYDAISPEYGGGFVDVGAAAFDPLIPLVASRPRQPIPTGAMAPRG